MEHNGCAKAVPFAWIYPSAARLRLLIPMLDIRLFPTSLGGGASLKKFIGFD
jgi:hypothetical protein